MVSKVKIISESGKEERRQVVFHPLDGNKAIMTRGAKAACIDFDPCVDIDQCDACDCGHCDKSSCDCNDDKQ